MHSQDRKLQLQNNYVKQGGSCKYLRCLWRHREAEGITSYTFEYQPSSRAKVLPDFKAGQYGSFEFEGLGQGNQKTIVRTWTLSSPPGEAMQRNSITLTVKKVGMRLPGSCICCCHHASGYNVPTDRRPLQL